MNFTTKQQNIAMIASAMSNLRVLSLFVDPNPYLHVVHVEEDFNLDGERKAEAAVELLWVLFDTFSEMPHH